MNDPEKATVGCLLLNKNPGMSSFESLRPVKKALDTGKVCHTGTLDSFARGLLVLLAGRAVKLSPWFSGCDKQYRALLRFGEETDTLDPEGAVIASGPLPRREDLEAALPAFTGTILQAPPLYSAIHINGKRAHELARAGIETEMKKRPVTIHSLSLLSWEPLAGNSVASAELEIHCSSGTYIRSLARDMALAIGSRAHLRSLVRTQVGNFSLNEALSLTEETANEQEAVKAALLPIDQELFAKLGIPSVSIDEKTERLVSHGGDLQNLPLIDDKEGSLALFGHGSFAALIEKKNGRWKYGFVNAVD